MQDETVLLDPLSAGGASKARTRLDPIPGEQIIHGFGWRYIAATLSEEKEVPADEELTKDELGRMIETGTVVVENGVTYVEARGGPLSPQVQRRIVRALLRRGDGLTLADELDAATSRARWTSATSTSTPAPSLNARPIRPVASPPRPSTPFIPETATGNRTTEPRPRFPGDSRWQVRERQF